MKTKILFIFTVFFSFSFGLTLFDNGKANFLIIIPENPTKAEEYSAKILSKYILKTAKVEVPIEKEGFITDLIRVNIGNTEYSKKRIKERIDEDGFIIDFPDKKNVIIYGGSDWGTLFGVYEFCERYLGVRWLFPGEIGEYIPEVKKIEIKEEKIKEEPYFISRQLSGRNLYWTPLWEKEINDLQIWANRLRMHGRISFHHNLLRLFPPEKYTKTNPEFFPVRGGKRYLPPSNESHAWQPCFSNEDTIKEAIKNICEYFSQNPNQNSYSLGVNDSSGYCECDNCRKYVRGKNSIGLENYSNLYYRWCNEVVKGVREKYPDKYFGLLAYSEVFDPPDFKLDSHIVPFITFERLKWSDENLKNFDKENTKRWAKFAETIGWYDYIYGKPTENYITPRVWFHLMSEYYRFAYENKVRYLYAEAYPSDDWREGPKLYVALKLQWNPYLDVDKILDEWYRCAVGEKSAPYLKKYFEFWEDYWTKKIPKTEWFKSKYKGQYLPFGSFEYLEPLKKEDIDYCENLLKKVVENTKSSKEKERAEYFLNTFQNIKKESLPLIQDLLPKLKMAKNPEIFKDKIISEDVILEEGFDGEKSKWSFWQRDYSFAKFEYDREKGNKNKGSIMIDLENSKGTPVCYLKTFRKDEKIKMEDEIYYFSCWYYSEGLDKDAKIQVDVQWRDKENKYIEIFSSKQGKVNQKNWDKLEIIFKTPSKEKNPELFTILLKVEDTFKGKVWFDDVYFSKIKLKEKIDPDGYIYENFGEGLLCLRSENGKNVNHLSRSSIQRDPTYQIKKIFDFKVMPEDEWKKVEKICLSIHFCVFDNSKLDNPPINGLDEEIEIIINGKSHKYPTRQFSVYPEYKWYDFWFDKEEFNYGINEIIMKKAESKKTKYDDYFYVGIDTGENRGKSFVSYDGGKTWKGEKLNFYYDANGEFMIRAYLLTKEAPEFKVEIYPGKEIIDKNKIIKFYGTRDGIERDGKLILENGQDAKIEWFYKNIDKNFPFEFNISGKGNLNLKIMNENEEKIDEIEAELPFKKIYQVGRNFEIGSILMEGKDKSVIDKIEIKGRKLNFPEEKIINISPKISKYTGSSKKGRLNFYKDKNGDYVLENEILKAKFTLKDKRLVMNSLYSELSQTEMIKDPEKVYLFLIGTGEKIYKGNKDFVCKKIKEKGNGFIAELYNGEEKINLGVFIEKEGLKMEMELINEGDEKGFKVCFPHIQGLFLSEDIENDYYFYPYTSGIIANIPSFIRSGYGNNQALYQIIDIFSPDKGYGLYLRVDDKDGWHKILTLQKYIKGKDFNIFDTVLPDYKKFLLENTLERIDGYSFCVEYMERIRKKGEKFSPSPCIISVHEDDWKEAMKKYSEWAHSVWKFRPYPNKLTDTWNFFAMTIGDMTNGKVIKDKKYINDWIDPLSDVIEMWGWWEWTEIGPWGRKAEELKNDPKFRWNYYILNDPFDGKLKYTDKIGDYKEYLGGLDVLKEGIKKYKEMGKLVTFYTDPYRCYDMTEMGKKYGKEWGVIDEKGEYITPYDAYRICPDNKDFWEYIKNTMERVMKETGVDGLRFDEYGLSGFKCYSLKHNHIFSEKTTSEVNKACAEVCKLVHEKMDRIVKNSILTTEFPGYDYMTQFLDGSITYFLSANKIPFGNPIVYIGRFYFPEFKFFELDHTKKDPECKITFFNGVGRFYTNYSPGYKEKFYRILKKYNEIFSSRNCETLIPSLKEGIYINRFDGRNGTIFTVYNASGYTYKGEIIDIPLKQNETIYDIINEKECEIERYGNNRAKVKIYIEKNDTACLLKKFK